MIKTLIFIENYRKANILEKKLNDFWRITDIEDVMTIRQNTIGDNIIIMVTYFNYSDIVDVKKPEQTQKERKE